MDEVTWKLCPFRVGNRAWAVRLFQGYSLCLLIVVGLAMMLNALEGEDWMKADKGQRQRATGRSAFDECLWFVFMTLHGIGFGEFMPEDTPGHVIAMLTVTMSYWCMIFMAAIVMLSQLPGAKAPSLFNVVMQIVNIVWPSYLIFVGIIIAIGFVIGPYVSDAPSGYNDAATGIYWYWCVMHRAPYGDIWPNSPFGRAVTVPAAVLSYLYPPYALALIAIRRPTPTEHAQLLAHMNAYPEEAMGPGYFVPPGGPSNGGSNGREVQLTNTCQD